MVKIFQPSWISKAIKRGRELVFICNEINFLFLLKMLVASSEGRVFIEIIDTAMHDRLLVEKEISTANLHHHVVGGLQLNRVSLQR
jgi:hypothetical protein